MAQILPYILPLMLGRTFDLRTMRVGVDIFPKIVIDNRQVIQNPVTETHYKIVDNAVEARDLLDVEGAFSLNVKAGIFKAGVSGEYLSDNYNRENTVEVAIKATYQTVTEHLPTNAKPIPTWQKYGDALGTHFVRSITYGGEMIAAIRFEANNTRDKMKIKGTLDVGGRLEVFDLGVEVEGEYMKDVSKSVESTQIKIFSSIPLTTPPNDMDSLKKTLDEFPNDLKMFNGGKGIPLKMELWPLKMLDSSRSDQLQNRLLEAYLDMFEQKFDDLLNTKAAISKWMKVMAKPFTDEQEQKIGDLYYSLENTLKVFYKVIGNLDTSQGPDQLKKADDAYGSSISGVFYKKYLLLRQEIAKDQGGKLMGIEIKPKVEGDISKPLPTIFFKFEWAYSKGSGSTYVHWGKSNCSDVAEQLASGTAVGPEGFGGGANYLCLPDSSDEGSALVSRKDASVIQRASFRFPGDQPSQIFCSVCRLGARGSVQVFSGKTACPSEWNYIYDGLLISGSHDATSTTFVCLDKNAEKKSTSSKNPLIPNWTHVMGQKNQADDQKRKLFPCVVCAK